LRDTQFRSRKSLLAADGIEEKYSIILNVDSWIAKFVYRLFRVSRM
jgi:hypothetical protein